MERPGLRWVWYGMTTVALGRFASWCAGRRPKQAQTVLRADFHEHHPSAFLGQHQVCLPVWSVIASHGCRSSQLQQDHTEHLVLTLQGHWQPCMDVLTCQ